MMCKISIWCNPDYAPDLFRYCGCVLDVPFTCYSGRYVEDSPVDLAFVKVMEEIEIPTLDRITKTLDRVASGYHGIGTSDDISDCFGAKFTVVIESKDTPHKLWIDGKHDLPNITELIGSATDEK